MLSLPLFLAAFFASSPEASAELNRGTRQLTTAELERLVVGAHLQRVIPSEMRWLEPGESFRRDGTYTEFVHRDKNEGTYRIQNNSVCVKIEGQPEACRSIFVDKSGLYWIAPSKTYVHQFIQIEFEAIDE